MKLSFAFVSSCNLLILVSLSGGCSESDSAGTSSGGAQATGGSAKTTGGSLAMSGGVSSTGGATTTATGGIGGGAGGAGSGGLGGTTSGGSAAAAGTNSNGGSATSGGTTGLAGSPTAMGGTTATGGTIPGGGTTATGGSTATGGTTAGGGSTATGGKASGGATSSCPLDLVGFATLNGGTTGGGNAAPTTVTTQAELKSCATAIEPRVCRVQGTLTFSPFEEIRVQSNKTIIGIGANAEIVMGGFFIGVGFRNVIIRNLTIRDSYIEGQNEPTGDLGGDRDGVQMDTASNIWIDHCRFTRLGDGLIDSRMDTTYETVSWNILEDHDKTFGIGWTVNVTAQMTIHHNWIRNTNQRNPSTDNVLRAHLFNNVLQNVTSYGNYARGGTNMVLQNSVFDQVNSAHYFDTGSLVAMGNVYRNTTGLLESSGTSFSFFDPGTFYSYDLDPASEVEALLARCAGPRAELGQ